MNRELIKKEDSYRLTRMRIDRFGNRIVEVLEVNSNENTTPKSENKRSILESVYLFSVSLLGFCTSFYLLEIVV
tara:strand:- start:105 stop:326 length:222 start_codon:yes stop_codon:yes gene_type:complete